MATVNGSVMGNQVCKVRLSSIRQILDILTLQKEGFEIRKFILLHKKLFIKKKLEQPEIGLLRQDCSYSQLMFYIVCVAWHGHLPHQMTLRSFQNQLHSKKQNLTP